LIQIVIIKLNTPPSGLFLVKGEKLRHHHVSQCTAVVFQQGWLLYLSTKSDATSKPLAATLRPVFACNQVYDIDHGIELLR
jgi:hypothetical protein